MKDTPSYNELRKISARQNETHRQLNTIIDQRKGEVDKLREQLYGEVQNFREAHQAELRRGVEVVLDLAVRSVPFWAKGSMKRVRRMADAYMVEIRRLTERELDRIKEEMDATVRAEEAEGEAKKFAADQLAAIRAGSTEPIVYPVTEDGYGGSVKEEELVGHEV